MNVLNSETAFREHYAKKAGDVFTAGAALVGGGSVAAGATGLMAWSAGAAAAQASAWSAFASWPMIGAFCAGKAAAVGAAATTAALTSAPVLIPAAALGLGVAGAIYWCKRGRKPLQKGSGVSEVAHAFARVAFLPMMAVAVSTCHADPASTDGIRDYVLKVGGAWGYSEAYVRDGFSEALRHSPEELDGGYKWAMGQLERGSTEGIGATPSELPAKAVRAFAEEFKKNFEACIG